MSTVEALEVTAAERAVLAALVAYVPETLAVWEVELHCSHSFGLIDPLPILMRLEGMGLVVSHRDRTWRPLGAGYLIGSTAEAV